MKATAPKKRKKGVPTFREVVAAYKVTGLNTKRQTWFENVRLVHGPGLPSLPLRRGEKWRGKGKVLTGCACPLAVVALKRSFIVRHELDDADSVVIARYLGMHVRAVMGCTDGFDGEGKAHPHSPTYMRGWVLGDRVRTHYDLVNA